MKSDDENCLVTRSKCHLQLGNAEAALTDAEAALALKPQLIMVCIWVMTQTNLSSGFPIKSYQN